MQIVQFSNGEYAVRKGFLFYSYLDAHNNYYWWSTLEYVIKYCGFRTYDEAVARKESYIQSKKKPSVIVVKPTKYKVVNDNDGRHIIPKQESIWKRLFKK